jgi:hypothetical protein
MLPPRPANEIIRKIVPSLQECLMNEPLAIIIFLVFCAFVIANWMNNSRLEKLRRK